MPRAAFAHDALLPRAPGGNGVGALLALLVHAALVAALTTAVDWRARTPDAVSAELWASVPQAAAPKPTETAAVTPPVTPVAPAAPTPVVPRPARPAPPVAAPPVEPDIAIEREQRRKVEAARKKAEAEVAAERKRLDAENRKTEAARKKREQEAQEQEQQRVAKVEEQRLARQREENLRRMMGQAGGATSATGGTGTAAQSAAPSAAYAGRLAALIRRNSVFTGTVPGNPAAEVEVRAAPNGTIIARQLVKSSGHKEWDEAVLRAIDRAGTLPRDVDGRVPQTLIVAFRPNE
ncbi:MAG: cell envelope integrity protein TolA [Rubrivivax sp.]|nr:cell envelope integrity protein TolA [Rubrivivax sp.]